MLPSEKCRRIARIIELLGLYPNIKNMGEVEPMTNNCLKELVENDQFEEVVPALRRNIEVVLPYLAVLYREELEDMCVLDGLRLLKKFEVVEWDQIQKSDYWLADQQGMIGEPTEWMHKILVADFKVKLQSDRLEKFGISEEEIENLVKLILAVPDELRFWSLKRAKGWLTSTMEATAFALWMANDVGFEMAWPVVEEALLHWNGIVDNDHVYDKPSLITELRKGFKKAPFWQQTIQRQLTDTEVLAAFMAAVVEKAHNEHGFSFGRYPDCLTELSVES